MKNKKIIRTLAATLAAVLCFAAFSTTAFAGGADPDPAPLPEETGTPTTGGIELDTEDGEGGSHTSGTTETSEDAENTEDKETTGAAGTMTDEEMAALLSSLLGSQVDVTVTDEGIRLTNKDDGTPDQTGTVVTNGGNLSVREAMRRFEINNHGIIERWERIYLEEGPEGLAIERRGRKNSSRSAKSSKTVEEDLIAENQRLRAENEYLKNLQALVLEEERRRHRKRR